VSILVSVSDICTNTADGQRVAGGRPGMSVVWTAHDAFCRHCTAL